MNILPIYNFRTILLDELAKLASHSAFDILSSSVFEVVEEITEDINDFYNFRTASKKEDVNRTGPRPGFLLRRNYDYGEGFPKIVDDYVKKQKRKAHKKIKASMNSIQPLDGYCSSKRNKNYWKLLKKHHGNNKAVNDFLKYIEEVKC